jgi:hypothetical protein
MSKRIVILGALAAVLICALVLNLSILDVITPRELSETLGRSLSVVAVSTAAIVIMVALLRSMRRSPDQHPDGRG